MSGAIGWAAVSSSRRTFLLGAAGAAVLAACGHHRNSAAARAIRSATTSEPATTTTAAPTGPAQFVPNGPRDGTQVALTFHGSGDHGLALALLDAAARAKAPITVFAVGTWLEQQPDMARRILDGGHELANHTYTHPALGSLGRAAVAGEIRGCRDVLRRQIGNGGRWFRPSGIDRPTQLMLEEAGTAGYGVSVGFDVDPHDYQDPGAAAIVSRVKTMLRPGSILSLHFGHAGTVTAFPDIVTAVHDRGLQPVLVHELLAP
jgi:peptidoglycan/xylan/chitin deacetylase (PgdA/CDA1 family)